MDNIDISQLSPAQLSHLFTQLKAAEQAERDARKVEREEQKGFLGKLVGIVAQKYPSRVMRSGAEGWSMGGKTIAVTLADGTVKNYRVNLLIRDEATIPAGDDKGDEQE